jgi:NAD(P)-dependent dehydrogenase (short-subunit alcohol dehydrogenase family)
MGQFSGKVALVTGAGSGIGRVTAIAYAREGAKVVVSDVTDSGQETVRLIEKAHGTARFVHADVASESEVEQLVAATVSTYGRLDFAFNNAGIGGESVPTADRTLDDWNRVIGINLTGVWLGMKYEMQQMLTQGGGVIVNNASILGLVGFRGSAAYVAAKHGVLGLTKTAALEYAQQGIRVTAICPGFIHTPLVDANLSTEAEQGIAALHAMGRMGTSEEIASGVIWLCSDGASFYTGQPLVIDGGYLAQ